MNGSMHIVLEFKIVAERIIPADFHVLLASREVRSHQWCLWRRGRDRLSTVALLAGLFLRSGGQEHLSRIRRREIVGLWH